MDTRSYFGFTAGVLYACCIHAQTGPQVSVLAGLPPYCTGVPLTFSALATGSELTYSWTITPMNGVEVQSGLSSSTARFIFNVPLNYSITVAATDTTGTGTGSLVIPVARTPVAEFYAELSNTGYPATLLLTNYSTSSIKNYWSYSHTSDVDSSFSTSKPLAAPGNYSVMLVSLSNKGCSDTAGYSFSVDGSSEIRLPNVFTPNNDGVNDVFRPGIQGISELKVNIFNRFGIAVAAWDKVNGFWDGYTTAGQPCSAGEYFVTVEATGFDGKTYKLKGIITLIR